MVESNEQLNQNKPDIFFDWGPYQGDKIRQELSSLGITYKEPEEGRELRKKIEGYLNRRDELNRVEILALEACLKFLEMGMMIDNFGNNEDERHKFLLNTRIIIGEEEISLYNLSKKVSKLSGNKISQISQLIDDDTIKRKGEELRKKIIKIKIDIGYFKPEDLKEVDDLALMIIKHILSKS